MYLRLLVVASVVFALIATASAQQPPANTSDADRAALQKTSVEIRAAFERGDVDAILSYHHPEVVKALAFNRIVNGREALRADLTGTLGRYKLVWQENKVESLLIHGDTAIEQTIFVINGTPRDGGTPFVTNGRAQIVYIRYEKSPTGWATIRKIIQPAQ